MLTYYVAIGSIIFENYVELVIYFTEYICDNLFIFIYIRIITILSFTCFQLHHLQIRALPLFCPCLVWNLRGSPLPSLNELADNSNDSTNWPHPT